MQIGIRPLLMPSRLEDVALKIMWGDEHWALPPAAGATVELVDGNVYLAMSLRNSGSGIGVIHGWHLGLHDPHTPHPHAEPDEFRPQLRDLYVPGGDIGFWQAALRNQDDPEYAPLAQAVRSSRMFLGRAARPPRPVAGRTAWLARRRGVPQGQPGGRGPAPRATTVPVPNLDRPDPR